MAPAPSLSSILKSWLYFATLSVRAGAPVLICLALMPTTKSAIVVSSVSPDLCETIALYPFFLASSIASSVSDILPIWLSLIRIAFAQPSSIPFANFSGLVTNKSSPTI